MRLRFIYIHKRNDMKRLLVLMCICLGTGAYAQQTDTTSPYLKNSGGIILQPSFGDANSNESGVGLQYKRWVKPFMAIRTNVTYNKWQTAPSSHPTHIAGNVLYEGSEQSNINMFNLGVGAEVQTRFYKRVYLYAAVDIRAGYGSGTYQYFEQATQYLPDNTKLISNPKLVSESGITKWSISSIPFVGVKMLFKRIEFGTELSAIYTGVEHTSPTALRPYKITNVEAYIGQLLQRVYIHYRF